MLSPQSSSQNENVVILSALVKISRKTEPFPEKLKFYPTNPPPLPRSSPALRHPHEKILVAMGEEVLVEGCDIFCMKC